MCFILKNLPKKLKHYQHVKMVRAPTTVSIPPIRGDIQKGRGVRLGRAPTTVSVPPIRGNIQQGSGVRKRRARKHKTRKHKTKKHRPKHYKSNVSKLIHRLLRG